MSSSTQYAEDYQQAVSAYMKEQYQEAITATDSLVEYHPDDPNLRLLRGHIYRELKRYEEAQDQYQSVLTLTSDPELVDCARSSLADTSSHIGSETTLQFSKLDHPQALTLLLHCGRDYLFTIFGQYSHAVRTRFKFSNGIRRRLYVHKSF